MKAATEQEREQKTAVFFLRLKHSAYLFGVELVNKKLKANMGPKK